MFNHLGMFLSCAAILAAEAAAGYAKLAAAMADLLNRQRNTYGIRCAAFTAHVRKCLRYAVPAVPAGH